MEQPSEIVVPLLPYQRQFLAWGVAQERSSVRGGILADEMGMGKTLQVRGSRFCVVCSDQQLTDHSRGAVPMYSPLVCSHAPQPLLDRHCTLHVSP